MPDHQSPAGNQDRIHERQSRSDSRPVEYYIDEKWDKCIDLTLRRVTYSTLAAGAVALVVLSELFPQICFSPSQGALLNFPELLQLFTAGGGGVRAATTAFGAGFGAGSAYGDCQREVYKQPDVLESCHTCLGAGFYIWHHVYCFCCLPNRLSMLLCSFKGRCRALCIM